MLTAMQRKVNRRRYARNERLARLSAFVSDGLALVATGALIAAILALCDVLATPDSYALVVTDSAGSEWVMDYDMTYSDCRNERARYALGTAMCDPTDSAMQAKG